MRILSYIIIYFLMVLITFVSVITLNGINYNGNVNGYILVSYISPTIVISCIMLLFIFSRIKIDSKASKVIKIVAPTAFSIYIINCHDAIWNYVIKDMFLDKINSPGYLLLKDVFLFSLGFVFVSCMIDLLRIRLFNLVKLNRLFSFVDYVIKKHLNRFN